MIPTSFKKTGIYALIRESPLVIFQKGPFLDRAPCAGGSPARQRKRDALRRFMWRSSPARRWICMLSEPPAELALGQVHCQPLQAEPSRVRRAVHHTLVLLYLKSFCIKTHLVGKKRFYRTYSSIRLRRKDKAGQRKKGLLRVYIFLPTKTVGGFGFSTANGWCKCFTALFVLGKILWD